MTTAATWPSVLRFGRAGDRRKPRNSGSGMQGTRATGAYAYINYHKQEQAAASVLETLRSGGRRRSYRRVWQSPTL